MTVRAWAELLRVSALFTVPGDALAGAAASGRRPDRGSVLAVGASLCLYEAGMALNDWADREEDAIDRPHRPIPSGRIAPGAALAAAGALTAAGLGLAARAGRPALAVATGLAATVWAYDLRLKHTPAGPAAMAAARGLDLLLGATATGATKRTGPGPGRGPGAAPGAGWQSRPGPGSDPAARGLVRGALPAAGLLGAHTYAVTAVSRHEAHGGSTTAPLAALAAVAALGAAAVHEQRGRRGDRETDPPTGCGGQDESPRPHPSHRSPATPTRTATGLVRTALTGSYFRTAAVPLLHAALNPSPPLTQRAVGGGIRAMIPLQAALAARAGAVGTGLAVMGLVPIARNLARKVSPT
ncbi:UbiA family prenyltransferase [Streptomyces sp. NBC_01591]|uniref:SCO3242 family prenyltransferase n=1 Tax=Streptomyces sp. NBC_01591 TaxID=2975888 RepID=UPI002DDBBCA7|nr:UbiA family prenyltransferase [Streptomyces sp. NBC_01591]WSD72163.1 UbiA family prenyltransferase [Streptomyces sp. NBC_01591]